MQIRGMYRGSLNQKWSIIATVGAAAYTTGTLSDTRWNNIVATGSVAFIRHLRPNLDLGFGASVNTMLGYPMPFPVFFIEWRLQNWYFVDLSFGDAVRAKIGTNFTNYFTLSVAAEMGGTMALDRLEKIGRAHV